MIQGSGSSEHSINAMVRKFQRSVLDHDFKGHVGRLSSQRKGNWVEMLHFPTKTLLLKLTHKKLNLLFVNYSKNAVFLVHLNRNLVKIIIMIMKKEICCNNCFTHACRNPRRCFIFVTNILVKYLMRIKIFRQKKLFIQHDESMEWRML